MVSRESLEFDVVIVGAGPAGLSASIRLSQLCQQENLPLSIAVLEKGVEVGSHILSGAVLEPKALNELIPNWQQLDPPIHTAVKKDLFYFLTEKKVLKLPTPPQMKNHGNYIISLGLTCRWLAKIAETMGVSIFPSFAATELLYQDNQVIGVITGDKGLDPVGNPKPQYQPGFELKAKQVILAEGCRGSLTEAIFKTFNLRNNSQPQTYGLGIKELWEVPPSQHEAGLVTHSIGWPLDFKTYGGSFIYHWGSNLVSLGFVTGLDYTNPYLNPYEIFQQFKTYPFVRQTLQNAKRLAYGARTLIEGGLQSIPTLAFPGGLIIGDAAGFLNVPKIKGIHTAMKSGMVAAESLFPALKTSSKVISCQDYPINLKHSWLWKELYLARNIRPAFKWGLVPGLLYAALDTYVLRGKAPWTLKHHKPDYQMLQKAIDSRKIKYPKHDQVTSFDLSASTYLANIHYDEKQPNHLKLKQPNDAITITYQQYASPETRYCPAGVYEILFNDQKIPYLQINSGNCIQCKACDIKDPTQNIIWTPSEGGSGPQYDMM